MRIGIDIDDTIMFTISNVLEYADRFSIEKYGRVKRDEIDGKIETGKYVDALYKWENNIKEEFYIKYYNEFIQMSLQMDFVSDALNKLRNAGHEIIFITARRGNIPNCDIKKITEKQFEKFNISFDEIIFNSYEKVDIALDKEIDIFIDDSYNICKEMDRNNIKVYLMTTILNENIDVYGLNSNIERVYDWNELYDKIYFYITNFTEEKAK